MKSPYLQAHNCQQIKTKTKQKSTLILHTAVKLCYLKTYTTNKYLNGGISTIGNLPRKVIGNC